MIELIVLYNLTKAIGNEVKAKGHAPFGYQLAAVLFWFGGELLGAMIGYAVSPGYTITLYVFGLVGAAIGAVIATLIAHQARPLVGCPVCGQIPQAGDRFCRRCGKPLSGAASIETTKS